MTTLRQLLGIERKYLELHSAIRELGGVECEELPDFFFPEEPERATRLMVENTAKEVCGRCPIRVQCLDYAKSTRVSGIWGGTTEAERY
jgi:hypothetical protein